MKHTHHTRFQKALVLTLVLLLLASLTGCWQKDDADSTGDTQGQTPAASTDAPPAPTPEPTTTPPTEAPTEAPTQPPTTAPENDGIMGTVTAARLNIREGAGSEYTQIGTYYENDRIEILETKGDWGHTDKGWINLAYVTLDNEPVTEKPNEKENTPGTTDAPVKTELVSDGKTTALGYGVVTLETLNVRTGPGTGYDKIGTVSIGSRYAYYQKSGNWVRIKDGWISTTYFYIEGGTGNNSGNGTISGTELNIRSGPGTGFDKVGTYKQGDTVKILEQVNKWGYTGKGWISMNYVTMDKTTATGTAGKGTITANVLNIRKEGSLNADTVGSYKKDDKVEILEVKGEWGRTDKGWISMEYVKMDAAQTTSKTGTITASILNIRKEGKKEAELVGSYKNGDKVTILETKDGWGKTDKGWISMDYVKMDS